MIIFGTRLFGKVDVVPGLFYVATAFLHVNFVPLVPTATWIIIDGSQQSTGLGSSWNGVQLASLRIGSVLMGWLRAGFVWAAILVLVFGLASLGDHSGGTRAAALGLVFCACVGARIYSEQLGRASEASLASLANDPNMPAELVRRAREALAGGASALHRRD